jgi:hypothetical protein
VSNLSASGARELTLKLLLREVDADVAVLSEVELPVAQNDFAITGFTTHWPLASKTFKTRVLVLTRSSLQAKLRDDLMVISPQTVWVEAAGILVGGFYRTWSNADKTDKATTSSRRLDLEASLSQIEAATASAKRIILTGDFNLDLARQDDAGYYQRKELLLWLGRLGELGINQIPTSLTHTSTGAYKRKSVPGSTPAHRMSCLDHVYAAGITASVKVLSVAATDHFPLLATVETGVKPAPPVKLSRRNFKRLSRPVLEAALLLQDWQAVFALTDVEAALEAITAGIVAALDVVCPVETIRVRKDADLYLSAKTRDTMAKRDAARKRNDVSYKSLRNAALAGVRGDRIRSHLTLLRSRPDDHALVWRLSGRVLGDKAADLPSSLCCKGVDTLSDLESASGLCNDYIEKVALLRDRLPPEVKSAVFTSDRNQCQNRDTTSLEAPRGVFKFSLADHGSVVKIIYALKSTGALGLDGIPVSVLKLGAEVLASPMAHLINLSLASGKVPAAFKTALVIPVYKGGGKKRTAPSSYRPVSLLPAMSKVLESFVKADLEAHLAACEVLPNCQYGFRRGRSAATALNAAHATWLRGRSKGEVVGILAFDLTAAFDTISSAQLLPKLEKMGVLGKQLDWFQDYLSGGRQMVEWRGSRSNTAEVNFGCRQGSILGPILFLALVADMPLHVGKDNLVCYADDTAIWASAKSHDVVASVLEARASSFASYVASCGLILNTAKTQLMISGLKRGQDFTVMVGGDPIKPSSELELLGVSFDSALTTRPQQVRLAAAARQRASRIARLAHHLPRGPYLRQLAFGLFYGKLSYAITTIVPPRSDGPPSALVHAIEVALRDVARTLAGKKREDRIKMEDLHALANIPTLNELVVKALASEAWGAYHSCDGPAGSRNPLGLATFGDNGSDLDLEPNLKSSRTRSDTAGLIPVPLRGEIVAINHMANMWNASAALREATTHSGAMNVARKLAAEARHP